VVGQSEVRPHVRGELDQLIKPTRGLKEGIGQVEGQGRAVALLVGFEV
jgi:hypothetical protein